MQETRRGPRAQPAVPKTDVVGSGELPGHADNVASTVPPNAEQTFIAFIRDELDSYFVTLKRLNSIPPEEVFAFLSGVSARLVEVRGQCWRSESRRLSGLRVHEVEPLLEEIDRQFRIHSRIQSVRQFELDMVRAAPA